MMILSRVAAVMLAAAVALSGCTSKGEGEGSAALAAGTQVFAAIKAKRASKGKAPFFKPTAKQLDNTKIPALQINLLTRGGSELLKRVTQRNDREFGTVAVWRSSDGAQIFLRNGVVVGTRGIGGDIISADAGSTIRAISGARAGSGERRYFVSDGAYSDREVVLRCDIASLGTGTTQVVHRAYTTVHLRETCVGGAGNRTRIINDYWVQPSNGTVRRSKQWVGPLSGYFELILLNS